MGHIHHIRIEPHTPEWHKFRYENGIGGSEIAPVLASVSAPLAELVYTTPIKWYLAKIGEPVQEFTGNVESESGHFFEGVILKWYRYMDLESPSQMDMFQRIKSNSRINRVISPKVYITNDKYPGFFYSPDAFTWPGYWAMENKDDAKKRLGECKNTTSMTARRFTNKVDPAFYCQVQQGLMLTELEEADLCILVDGRWFEVITIKANPEIHKKILEVGSDMWKRVLKARMLKIEYDLPSYYGINPQFLNERQQEGAQLLSSLEPDLLGTEDELDFIREMVKPTEEETQMIATPEQLELCKEYFLHGGEIKKSTRAQDSVKEKLILSLGGFHKAEFEDKSFFSYKVDAKGSKRLYVQDKIIKSDKL
jgi:hypothetical protein